MMDKPLQLSDSLFRLLVVVDLNLFATSGTGQLRLERLNLLAQLVRRVWVQAGRRPLSPSVGVRLPGSLSHLLLSGLLLCCQVLGRCHCTTTPATGAGREVPILPALATAQFRQVHLPISHFSSLQTPVALRPSLTMPVALEASVRISAIRCLGLSKVGLCCNLCGVARTNTARPRLPNQEQLS